MAEPLHPDEVLARLSDLSFMERIREKIIEPVWFLNLIFFSFLVLRSLGGASDVPIREKGENWPIKELSQKAVELT